VEAGMQNSGLGVVLAKENFVNLIFDIPAAISGLVHSLNGFNFCSSIKNEICGFCLCRIALILLK
tara:strand:+ start:517 stop:711 length:195 start_codon:yes stop_codon:yes gene_type:complete